jgi:hypothetical protein
VHFWELYLSCEYCCHLMCICCILCLFVVNVCVFVVLFCVFVVSHVYLLYLMCICCTSYVYLLYYVCIVILTLDAGLLARSQYPEGLVTGHLDTGFPGLPWVYKRMLRWIPNFQVATTCLSCSPPDLNFLVTLFPPYLCTCKITTATGW